MSKGKYKRKREHRQSTAQEQLPQAGALEREQQKDNSGESQAARDDKKEPPMRFGKRILELWKQCTLTDRIIAIFTGVLAAAAIYQFIVMNGQLEEMRKAGRPYIFAKPIIFDPVQPPGSQVSIPMLVKDTGKIMVNIHIGNASQFPATRVIASDPQVAVGPDAMKEAKLCKVPYPDSSKTAILSPIADVDDNSMVLKAVEQKMDETAWDRLRTGTDLMFIWGGVRYSGITGGDFETVYCVQVDPSGLPFSYCGFCSSAK